MPLDPVPATGTSASAQSLLDALLSASSLREGAHRLAGAITVEVPADRASIGLYERGQLRLVGTSGNGAAELDPESRAALLGAMQEAADQAVTLALPGGNRGIGPVVIEHANLQARRGGVVASVPLGEQGELVGVVCIERTADTPAFDAHALHRLEQMLVPLAPALRWMRSAEQSSAQRVLTGLQRRLDALRQPERRLRRFVAAGAMLVVVTSAVIPLPSTVSGRARIEGGQQRVLSAPADGFVKVAHARPGDRVHAGDPLVELVDADLRLERERWSQQLAQHENAYAAAMAKSDRVAAATSLARAGEATAQLALVDDQLARGQVNAPFDGLVVDGDLSRSIGAPVRQGDTLMTVASSGRHRVMVEVDEVDIARVQPGQRGSLALSSLPWDREPITVERCAPLARAVDGRNVFEVEARLESPRDDLRAGLLGRATLDADRLPVLWDWTRGLLLRLRVAVWAWLD